MTHQSATQPAGADSFARLKSFLSTYRHARRSSGPDTDVLQRFTHVLAALASARKPSRARQLISTRGEETVAAFVRRFSEVRSRSGRLNTTTNLWSIAGLKRDEVRIAAVLAWALDCRGSHGFGDAIAVALLETLRTSGRGDQLRGLTLGSDYVVRREYSAFGIPDDRIDVSLVGDNCVLFIECKIDAREGDRQLERYRAIATQKAHAVGKVHGRVLYLSGFRPTNLDPDVTWLSWKDVARAIRRAVVKADGTAEFSTGALRQFADFVGRLHPGGT